MANDEHNDNQSLLDKLMAILSGLPWPEALGNVWKIITQELVLVLLKSGRISTHWAGDTCPASCVAPGHWRANE